MKVLNSGVYEIRNLVNGKRYIGSAVNFVNRWSGHKGRLQRGRHHSRYLQNSWSKYGPSAFEFRRLLVCGKSDLLIYEQRCIDAFRPEYNINPTAGSSLGCMRTAETRSRIAEKACGRKRDPDSVERGAAKLRGMRRTPETVTYLLGNKHAAGLKHTDEWKARNSLLHTGRKRPKSPEYRAKISAALKGIKHSPERRAKQAAAQLGRKHRPYKLNPDNKEQRAAAGRALAAAFNGGPMAPERVAKMRASLTGRRLSEQHRKTIGVASKAAWDRRRAARQETQL